MEILIKGAQLLLSLSILIILHELGHFLPAKWFKIRVEKFYLFFDAGFSLFKIKKGETEYGIGWLPLGGYVKIAGMIDESLDNELDSEPQPWEFRSKPAWQRLIIMVGGVVVNLIVGFVIYMMLLFVWGLDYVQPGNVYHGFDASPVMEELGFQDGDQILKIDGEVPFSVLDVNKKLMIFGLSNIEVEHPDGSIETINVPEGTDMKLFLAGEKGFTERFVANIDSVVADRPAEEAGFMKGDIPIAVNNEATPYWTDFTETIQQHKKEKVTVSVLRDTDTLDLVVKTDEDGKIGVAPGVEPEDVYKVDHKDYGFFESIGKGFGYGYNTLYGYVAQFKFVFTAKGSTGIGGFGAIGGMFPNEWNWELFWERTAMISIILAFMNILPIPALDGGHVLFLLYEIISGKAPSDKFLTRAQVVGMIILLGLLLYANGLDIYRWITGG
ncbi:RIP metalloprotease RseP [Parvicella tangerina]|uniref:Zinc metalloprotease n=1 Tax=Parvicella tangerina TaxID=2829795 RepID=A0A916JQR7_9FLAO|nr:RIP metalloprotease RseP [Parvicella tangerina]CAG5087813.1 Putative zinc metalloprotease [Parvicella tangerina]